MTNRGSYSGVRPAVGVDYTPTIRAFSSAGTGIAQPDFGNSVFTGRFHRKSSGLVYYSGGVVLGSTYTQPATATGVVWGFSLPVPANRSSGAADIPMGIAWSWQNTVSNINKVLTPTLMDPLLPDGKGGVEDYYMQLFIGELYSTGTATFVSAATTATVAHGLAHTPNAYDIHITATNAASTAPKNIFVSSTDATNIVFGVGASSTTTPQTLSWSARALPNNSTSLDLLLGHDRPWLLAAGMSIGWKVTYEGRR